MLIETARPIHCFIIIDAFKHKLNKKNHSKYWIRIVGRLWLGYNLVFYVGFSIQAKSHVKNWTHFRFICKSKFNALIGKCVGFFSNWQQKWIADKLKLKLANISTWKLNNCPTTFNRRYFFFYFPKYIPVIFHSVVNFFLLPSGHRSININTRSYSARHNTHRSLPATNFIHRKITNEWSEFLKKTRYENGKQEKVVG